MCDEQNTRAVDVGRSARKPAEQYQLRIRKHLEQAQNLYMPANYVQLQQWQSARLLQTHQALYQVAHFRPAMDFFKDELYGSTQFYQRNSQLLNALPLMCSTLPISMLRIVDMAAELQALSLTLDLGLLAQLGKDYPLATLTLADWVQAYRNCANPNERDQQIALIADIGNGLASLVNRPMIGHLLKWAKVPATIAGYGNIHQFVCRGFLAFQALRTPDAFLTPVIGSERILSNRWFHGDVVIDA